MLDLGISHVGYGSVEPTIMAGIHGKLEVTDIVIASGQNLAKGTLLGKVTATGKYKIYDTTKTDGTENLAGVLPFACDATSGDENAYMYVHGEFNRAELTAAQTVSAGVYNSGTIVIKEEY